SPCPRSASRTRVMVESTWLLASSSVAAWASAPTSTRTESGRTRTSPVPRATMSEREGSSAAAPAGERATPQSASPAAGKRCFWYFREDMSRASFRCGRRAPRRRAGNIERDGRSGSLDQVRAGEDLAVGEPAAPPGEHLAAALGDDDGVLELGGEGAVDG